MCVWLPSFLSQDLWCLRSFMQNAINLFQCTQQAGLLSLRFYHIDVKANILKAAVLANGKSKDSIYCVQLNGRAKTKSMGKKKLIMLFWPILGHFCCSVVTLVTFSSNLSTFRKICLISFPILRGAIQPKLSSQARFRIQRGSPEPDGGRTKSGRKSLCLILD